MPQPITHKPLSWLSPLLGTGGVGVCPACVTASATLLSWLGLGILVPVWRPIALTLLGLGVIGFIVDWWRHQNPWPLALLVTGSFLLYVGRYVFGGPQFTGWELWLPGMVITITAVYFNRKQFRHFRPSSHTP